MRARLLNVNSDNSKTAIIKLKGKWLEECGFRPESRIIVCNDEYGRLLLINLDVEANRMLEEEFEKQVHMIDKE